MIVVDASALLEALLRAPAAAEVERRLFDSQQTLHAPHLLDVEVAQVVRCDGIHTISYYRASGNCGAISRPTTPFTSLSPKHSVRRYLRATDASPPRLVIMHKLNLCKDHAICKRALLADKVSCSN
jgi:hypothetical protein